LSVQHLLLQHYAAVAIFWCSCMLYENRLTLLHAVFWCSFWCYFLVQVLVLYFSAPACSMKTD